MFLLLYYCSSPLLQFQCSFKPHASQLAIQFCENPFEIYIYCYVCASLAYYVQGGARGLRRSRKYTHLLDWDMPDFF